MKTKPKIVAIDSAVNHSAHNSNCKGKQKNVKGMSKATHNKTKMPKAEDANNTDEESYPKDSAKGNGKDKSQDSKYTSETMGTSNTNQMNQANTNKVHEPSVVITKKVPVDSFCPLVEKVHVYCAGSTVYHAMLHQTDISKNTNSFYLMQLLEDNNERTYIWTRWGRVGNKKGRNLFRTFETDLEGAIEAFSKKFCEKTGNLWQCYCSLSCIKKVSRKHHLLEMDYSSGNEPGSQVKKQMVLKLNAYVLEVIILISDRVRMQHAILEMKYDPRTIPLGKLTKEQVKLGYLALKNVENCFIGIYKDVPSNQPILTVHGSHTRKLLIDACNEYYTYIPRDFGRRSPPLILTREDVQTETLLLEALGDIHVTLNLLNETHEGVHPCDSFYESLKCQLDPLVPEDEYQMVCAYLWNTHGCTHNYKLNLVDVFKCTRTEEMERFKDYGNCKLLWHGSRLTNWASILKQGLRIAPPEAPVSGYMFGKGIYFTDIASKTANYCFATQSNNEGLLVLCEVSLGNCNELIAADYNASKLPEGKHSVHALGKWTPDPKYNKILPDGVCVPLGKPLWQTNAMTCIKL